MSQRAFLVACFYTLNHPHLELEIRSKVEETFSHISGNLTNMNPYLLVDMKKIGVEYGMKAIIEMMVSHYQSNIRKKNS